MPLMSDKNSMSRPYNLESYRRPSERVRWDRKDKERGRRGGGGASVVYRKKTVHDNSI